jgi:L-amino acid N-acyltransferase YncA
MKISELYEIRPVKQADLARILEILNASILSSPANFHWLPRPPSELQDEWKNAVGKYPWLVMVERKGGAAIGFAKAGEFRVRQAYAWTVEVTIYMGVGAQGRGCGEMLYRALLEQLTDAGYHLAVGAITLPNPASESLHRKLGFEPAGVLPEVGWKSEAWHDVAFWAKRLGEGPADARILSAS